MGSLYESLDLAAPHVHGVVDVPVGLAHPDLVRERHAWLVGCTHRAQDLDELACGLADARAAPQDHVCLAAARDVPDLELHELAAQVAEEEAGPSHVRGTADRQVVFEYGDALAHAVAE